MKKSFTHKFFSCLLLACLCLAFSGEATAAVYTIPKWMSFTAKYSIERNTKIKDPKNPKYFWVKLVITYANNSPDKVITKIFKKSTSAEYIGFFRVHGYPSYLERSVLKKNPPLSHSSTKVNNVEIYPGQKYSLQYDVTPKDFPKSLGISQDELVRKYNEGLLKRIKRGDALFLFIHNIKHGYSVAAEVM